MRSLFIKILIALLLKDFGSIQEVLTREQEDGLLSQLWQNPAFRKFIAVRESKLLYQLAGGEGMQAEPRATYLMHTGQRVENLLLARDAKAAYGRIEKRRSSSLTPVQEKS